MRIAVVGARGHRALAQVLRRVRELPEGATVVAAEDGAVGSVALLAARQRGLATEPLAGDDVLGGDPDEVAIFDWGNDDVMWPVRSVAEARGIAARVHEPAAPALLVFSAQRRYAGPGAFCIMRYGGEGDGLAFAPTESLLQRALAAREQAAKLREAAAALRGRQLRLGESADEVAARGLRATSLEEQAAQIETDAWAAYAPAFRSEMRVSFGLTRDSGAWARRSLDERALLEQAWERGARPRPDAWRRLLGRSVAVLLCACPDPERCHRGILRAEILPALGAVDGGELNP